MNMCFFNVCRLFAVVGAWALLGVPGVSAQDPELGETGGWQQQQQQQQQWGQGGQQGPGWDQERPTTTVSQSASTRTESDHSQFVRRFGIGFFGVLGIPYMDIGGPVVPAPTVGVRYWFTQGVGLDVALGVGYYDGETDNEPDFMTSVFALALHAGVPLALAHEKHYTFLLTPELSLGFASGTTWGVEADQDIDLGGFLVDVGARVGCEIHFGFIDIPQLALQASVGFSIRYVSATTSVPDVDSESDSRLMIGTTLQNSPWDIFRAPAAGGGGSPAGHAHDVRPSPWDVLTSSMAAIYYF